MTRDTPVKQMRLRQDGKLKVILSVLTHDGIENRITFEFKTLNALYEFAKDMEFSHEFELSS